jgi:nitrite reductase (NO-forming)
LVNPGEQVVLRFKATRAGVFVYHCAPGGTMIPWHVVSGMSGAIMVLPRGGLKDGAGNALPYDRVYYIGENDFYIPRSTDGKFKSYNSLGDDYNDMIQAMRGLIPTHVVFNGKVGALTGKNALTAKVGETVLIVHSQANRDSRPHLIGGHGDYVWETGKFSNAPERDLETWFIRGGSAGAALYRFREPGIYAYLSHNLIEAVELGATAHFKVEGEWDDDLMTQVQPPQPIPANVQGAFEAAPSPTRRTH